jgi:ketosteroid isomerase-like protein
VTDGPENVAIIHRSWDAWMERDMDRAASDWHPDIVWDITRHEGAPDTVHPGVAEVMEMIANWIASFRAYELSIERLEPAGDNVLLLLRRRGATARAAKPSTASPPTSGRCATARSY